MDTKSSSASTMRHMGSAQSAVNRAHERISSGSRINRAADDAAGLAISTNLDAIVAELGVATRNTSYGISFGEIADSTMGEIGDIMTRMGELATASANGVYSDEQRANLNAEYQALAEEAQRITASTKFNGRQVFGDESISIQAGTDSSGASQIRIGGTKISSVIDALAAQDISTQAGARTAVDTVGSQIEGLSSLRGAVGAVMQRLDEAATNNRAAAESLQASSSRIRDADIAAETAHLTADNIRMNANAAMLAQANASNQIVLSLLG